MLKRVAFRLLFAISVLSSLPAGTFGQNPPTAVPHIESLQDLRNRLTPEQSQQLDSATKFFNVQQYAAALPVYKNLLKQMPGTHEQGIVPQSLRQYTVERIKLGENTLTILSSLDPVGYFFVGQPPYQTVRDEFIKVATGKVNPMSSRTGLVVPN